MPKLDIEEKFKKDISKEVATLKEFLISQGKEIVKLKQDNKSLRENSSARSENGSVPPDLHALLDRHTKELAKQKENTTKLSKLCLGTLNELEKFEKKTDRETSAKPSNEDRIKKLGDENKKLIHLVTALDQQMTVMEGKFARSMAEVDRGRGGDITREDVIRMVREGQENPERDAQVQSMVEEVQRVMGQVRELGQQVRDTGDRVRRLQGKTHENTERVGVELAEAVSRVEILERHGVNQSTKTQAGSAPASEAVTRRLDKLEVSLGAVERLDREVRTASASSQELRDQVNRMKPDLEEAVQTSEDKVLRNIKNNIGLVEKELAKTSASSNTFKTNLEDVSRKIERMQKEEEAARNVRRDQNVLSVEDIKKDFVKVQDQTNYLEEKIVTLQKLSESTGIESRNKCTKISNDVELLTEKLKNVSLAIKDDKIKTDEKINRISNTGDAVASLKDEVDRKLSNITQTNNKLERASANAEELAKASSRDIQNLKSDISTFKTNVDKCVKNVEENSGKIFGCVQDCEMLKDNLDKLKKAVDRRPAAEDLDKKSELTNKLYNDLSSKIDDVDASLQKETKKTRSDLEKISKDIKSTQTKTDDLGASNTKDLKLIKDDLNTLKINITEVKNCSKDMGTLKSDCDKSVKDLKLLSTKVDEMKKDVTAIKTESSSFSNRIDKLQLLEKEMDQLKRDKNSDKLTSIEKDISSLRADCEKLNKDIKGVSTEVKYVDSTMKKDTGSTKTEISNFAKSIKGFEKDLNTIHNMIDVLNEDKTDNVNTDEMTRLKYEVTKSSKETADKCKAVEDTVMKKINTDIKDFDSKIQKVKDEINLKVTAIEKKVDTTSKGLVESDVNRLIKASKDDVTSCMDTKVKKCKEELQTSYDKLQTDAKKISDLQTKITKQEDNLSKIQKTVDSLDSSSKQNKPGEDLKKELEKASLQIKENMKTLDGKITTQERNLEAKIGKTDNQVIEVKKELKDLSTKAGSAKPDDSLKKDIEKISSQLGDQEKNLTDKISKQIYESQRTVQDKIAAQEKSVKDAVDKIAKLEKNDATNSSKAGGETAKLAVLTKAIDSIQDNSKSLEMMVKKMKSEFVTPKDLEKLRVELSKAGAGAGKLDPTHPDMGPIMDSLIMTNDRPYIDCGTTTPMTGTGLVKFERFTAINKLPWDDVNDQFVIQEPGVYAVFVSAILQDASLSVKIASNMLEREILSVGSREGLVGCSAPSFVSRGGLLQIDDDENVADTVIVEIHADNDESFIDKNVTFTMYKIGESPGGE